ncbi:MAG: hypothetical protein LBT91_01005, partial [Bifidobacteriaceae bacterium]|nr:hypothetical protein [Bifidobacteriaceae bacterium]
MQEITNKEYFADKSYWHQSSLKSLLTNPISAIESKLGLTEISTSSLNKGNATHFLVLGVGDPITSASELGFKDFRTKEARQARDEKIEDGYVILNDTQWLESQYAADAVFANPLYKVVDKAQYKECAVYGELNGVKVAAKPDAVYIYEEDG